MNITRAALYIRVSTEEQVREGYSVEAQKAHLEKYAKDKGYAVVDYYIDEGITARRKYTKRKELMRLLDDVEEGKIDIILFIKLDRWFRSVGDYYKIQEILDRNKVDWIATTENYDTTTANGRLHINIRLAVAQDESDRTSERIKFVFEKKIADGEAIWGEPPFGYKVENKKVVMDEEEMDFVYEIFQAYKKYRSVNAVCKEMNKKRDVPMSYNVYSRILRTNLEFYAGVYRSNEEYCPPYLSEEEYQEIKAISDSTTTTKARNGNKTYDYIFTGLLKCNKCGRAYTGGGYCKNSTGKYYYYYRCSGFRGHFCDSKRISESQLEAQLFSMLESEMEKYKVEYEIKKKPTRSKPRISKESIEKKIKRLRTLYLNELIEIDDYEEEYLALQAQLEELEEKQPEEEIIDFTNLERILESDFRIIYDNLGNLEKRKLWHEVIETIYLEDKKIISIEFK